MRLPFAFLILLAFSFCGNNKPAIESDIIVKSVFKGAYSIDCDNPTGRFILVEIKLINNSNTLHRFLTTNCTTSSNLIFELKNVAPVVNICAGNSITPVTLNPRQEFSFTTILKLTPPYPDYLKIGWILLTMQNLDSRDYYPVLDESRQRLENIIWAPPIEILTSGGDPYEVK